MDNEILILGIKINDLDQKTIMQSIDNFLNNQDFNLIFTPNPEICLKAYENRDYRHKLNDADIRIPDGYGLKLGAEILDQKLHNKITGVDLTKSIIDKYSSSSIFIINNEKGLSSFELIKNILEKKYPKLKVYGIDTSINNIDKIANQIFDIKPDLVFCTLGAPDQETLLHKLKFQYKVPAKLGLAVGGTFDFITGKQTRAPKWWQNHGIEWFYRLIKQPQRLNRITDATIKFPLVCHKWKSRMESTYRQNAMAIITKNNKYLVQQNPRFGEYHWQFPQGGVDKNENPEDAAIREASEETGIKSENLKLIKRLPITHDYNYPHWHQLLNGYLGQRQQFFLIEYTGNINNTEFTSSYEASEIKWVNKEELQNTIHPKRHESLKKILKYL